MSVAASCGHGITVPPHVIPERVVDGWQWDLPKGFPPPAVPEDNPMSAVKVELGRKLFFDTRLSVNGTTSCATCHDPERAFTDGREGAVGATGEVHPRNTMSLTNVAYNATLTWADDKLVSLEEQAKIPLLNTDPIEMGMAGNEEEILDRLRDDAEYVGLFRTSFDDDTIDLERVVMAIAAFERTLISGNSPYDRYLFHDELDALSPAAKRGMDLFFSSRLKCSECHEGINFSGPLATADRRDEPVFHNTGLGDREDLGLYDVTGNAAHIGKFRAPTLRNVTRTAPYMHDGSLPTLEAVLDHYASGGAGGPLQAEQVRGFELGETERNDVIAFLDALSDAR